MRLSVLPGVIISLVSVSMRAQWTPPADPPGTVPIYYNGNVGIGVTSAGASLEVGGVGAKFSGVLATETHGDANLYAGVMFGTPRIIWGGASPHEIDNYSGYLRFFRPGVVDMTIDPSGNIG